MRLVHSITSRAQLRPTTVGTWIRSPRWQVLLPLLSLSRIQPVVTWSSLPTSKSISLVAPPCHCILDSRHNFLTTTMSGTRSSPRRSKATSTSLDAKNEPDDEDVEATTPKPKAKSPATKAKKSTKAKKASPSKKKLNVPEDVDSDSTLKSPAKKKKAPATKKVKGSPAKKRKSPDSDSDGEAKKASAKKSPAKKKKAKGHQRITEVDELPKLWTDDMATANGSRTFRIASWNVAGLRAFDRKQPTALADICKEYNLDMLCIQEHKLQEQHLDDPKLNFRGYLKDAGYDDYWSFSLEKKGYSGTAVFVKDHGKKKKTQKSIAGFFKPKGEAKETNGKQNKTQGSDDTAAQVQHSGVSYGIGKDIDKEGRSITVDYPFATITNVYVPNSGQKLERLDYRTTEWDTDFLTFQQEKEKDRKLPVIWLGDLNIAHKAYDIWNDGASHLNKQAGVTPQERESFQAQLDTGYIDAFRKLHPEAKGHYSYWSMRAGNREPNQGLRLDYFVCSPEMFSEGSKAVVRDSFMLPHLQGSDHSPVVLEIEIKKAT